MQGPAIQDAKTEPGDGNEGTSLPDPAESGRREVTTDVESEDSSPVVRAASPAIRGTLRDANSNLPVGPATVHLKRKTDDKIVGNTKVGEEGRFAFSDLTAEGTFVLLVDDLPDGYLPPFRQETEVLFHEQYSRGYFATVVRTAESGEVEQDLFVHRSSTVNGLLLGAQGEPVAGGYVYLMPLAAGLQQDTPAAFSDERGEFVLKNVRPGRYRSYLRFLEDTHAYAHEAQPPPEVVDVAPGIPTTLTLRLGTGNRTIRGVVLDQDGAPFAGAEVLAYYFSSARELGDGEMPFNMSNVAAKTRTDEAGRFTITSLHPRRVKLQFERNGWNNPVWHSDHTIPHWIDPVTVDLRLGDQSVHPVTLPRSRPFIVDGTIRCEGDPSRYEVVVYTSPSDAEGEVVAVSEQGTFLWGCETPHDGVTLTVRTRERRREQVWAATLVPVPRRQPLEVRL